MSFLGCQHFISDWLGKLKPNKLSTGCQNELKGAAVEKATNPGRRFLLFSFSRASRANFAATPLLRPARQNRHATQATINFEGFIVHSAFSMRRFYVFPATSNSSSHWRETNHRYSLLCHYFEKEDDKFDGYLALSIIGPFIRGKIRLVLNKTRTFRINGTFRLK